MRNQFSNTYLRFVFRMAKYIMIAVLVAGAGVIVAQTVVLPTMKDRMLKRQGVQVVRTPDGAPQTLYSDEKVPDDYDDELAVGAPQLIYENQARSQADASGHHEDHEHHNRADVRSSDRTRLLTAATKFLRTWETFRVGESDVSYSRRLLAAGADPTQIQALVDRIDNMQNPAIGRDAVSGSAAVPDGKRSMRILRYDGATAYVAVIGQARFTGPSLTWAGQTVHRAYALIMTRYRDGWKVTRAAAQTQGQVIS